MIKAFLIYFITQLVYYPVIMTIFANVRGEKLNLREIITISLSFFVIDITPFHTIILRILILFLISYLSRKDLPLSLHMFNGSFPWVIDSIIIRTISFFVLPIFGLDYIDLSENEILFIIVQFSVLAVYFFSIRISKINFQTFIEISEIKSLRKKLVFTDITMIFYYTVIEYLTAADFEEKMSTLIYRQWIVFLYFLFFILMLVYMNRSYQNRLEKEIASAREQELRYLSAYSKKVEGLYEELRAFRHDYANILVSLKEGIDQDDMGLVRKIYDSVLEDSADFIRNSKFNIGRLVNIDDDAIKSLLSAKFLEAEASNIEVDLEVKDKIGAPNIPLLDYIRLLAILCDNAIEAALEAKKPAITIACFYQDDDYVLIVDNTTKEESVPVNLIYQKDYSSKGYGRGIGLTTIHQMMRKYSNLSVQTNSKNYHFSQTIRIKKSFD
ncbi:sensor histidine kinase [Streptococcus equinus]|jgi:two-component system sensor histidine kinase AgrC|uniref:Two-component system, AgrA family, sensor histidine kinase AgrC n=2 Tax=Streptococcus equinus TaxID=1335 RepID=A0A1I4EU40_STREI|nr:GHKL domain-containing protein [Streptococcus equinus]UVF02588.1 GHKL domain-containing protein [Streptococcus equinus]BAF37249.1 putative histidine kinase of the competence regulon ComD1 [Streptococcus equinus]SFL09214.1 two-component system, AgrA family, sensor histidine kinase AgrC [Streptococcus equinus JB1]